MDTPRDPDLTVKLFGNTIALSDSTGAAAEVSTKLADDIRSNPGTKCIPNKILNVKSSSFCSKDTSLNGTQSVNNQNEKMETDSKPEEVKTESDGSDQENELNKPNNILPCPRCNSMDTKLCYFNNQNVNQPRHLCRSCSRYWTVGGTVRNVPIGAARRTYKRSNHRRHAMMSCDGNVSDGDASDAIHQQSPPIEPHVLQRTVRENENVTRSGSGVPFWSKVPVFSTKEKDYSSGCSGNWIPENTVTKEQNNVLGNHSGLKETHPHIQSYRAGPASVVPWSPGWNNVNDMASTQCSIEYVHGLENGTTSKVSLPLPIMMSAPGLSAPVVPSPLMPPLWSCIPDWPNGMWSSPWPASNGSALSSPPPHSITCSGNNSPKLGKHSREETLQGGEKKGNNICVPKVLRITDPKDVAKSSFLASLGIKPDDKCICKSFQSEVPEGCKTPESPQAQQANQAVVSFPLVAPLGNEPDDKSIFKSFQSEVPEGCKTPASPQAQQANPAAASRSQSFQERM